MQLEKIPSLDPNLSIFSPIRLISNIHLIFGPPRSVLILHATALQFPTCFSHAPIHVTCPAYHEPYDTTTLQYKKSIK